ncbi:MAG: methionine--tRNA ligase subunit beta, partial [Candidatus Latescibacterota bacterium]
HTQHRDPSGGLRYEELMGEEGFSADSSLLYHRHIPSAVVDAQPWELPDLSTTPNAPLLPRHLRLHELFPGESGKAADVVTGRRLVLGNADVRISYVVAGEASPLYRNAVGDECVYVEEGTATVETVFGTLRARQGDYVLLPCATTHRWLPDDQVRCYVIEANSHIAPPKRYLSRYGQFLEHAPYCERDHHGPEGPLLADGTDVEVLVKHRGSRGLAGTRYVVPHHPFDVVGWDGCLYPYTFNVADFEPITGRGDPPPPGPPGGGGPAPPTPAALAPPPAGEGGALGEGISQIGIEEFGRVDLRVAEVVAAERVPRADKLLVLTLRLGSEERTVVSGIAEYCAPETLPGRKVVLVANLKPAKLRGIVSQGMILAAIAPDGRLTLVEPDASMPSGSQVR